MEVKRANSPGLGAVDCLNRGFGGRVAHYSPSYDYVCLPFLYWLGTRVYPRVRGALGA